MQIARFILDNVDSILQAWEDFAANIISASKLNKAELRDHAKGMLLEIAADIGTHQSKREQSDKS